MSKLTKAIINIHKIDDNAEVNKRKDTIHPVAHILVTILYILYVVSFSKYDIWGLMGMILYLMAAVLFYNISIRGIFFRIWPVLFLVSMVGIANPFVDRAVYLQTDFLTITFGMISMVTLMLKGIFSVFASYILVTTTGIEQICYGLCCLHMPKELVTIFILMERYLIVLLKETERMSQAYKLRSYGQKGIHIKAWGSFVGQLLLRSIERAELVYESMLLRGYNGEFINSQGGKNIKKSIIYIIFWSIIFTFLRTVPIFQIVGSVIQ